MKKILFIFIFTITYISSFCQSTSKVFSSSSTGIPPLVGKWLFNTSINKYGVGDGTKFNYPIYYTDTPSLITTHTYTASSINTAISGSTNYIPYFTGAHTIGNSSLYQNSSNLLTIGYLGTKPVTVNTSTGVLSINGASGGWATGYNFTGSTGTAYGGFDAFGSSNTLVYWFIGDSYTAPGIKVYPTTGIVWINASDATGNFITQDASGYIRYRTPTEVKTDLGLPTYGTATFSGNGSATTFTATVPSGVKIYSAISAGTVPVQITNATISGTTATFTTASAPASGTNNVIINYIYGQ